MDAPNSPPATTEKDVGDLAASALKAAQAAVSSLQQDAGVSAVKDGTPPDQIQAAHAAIAQAKAANGDSAAAGETPPTVGEGGGPIPRGTTPKAFSLPNFGSASGAARTGGIDLLADVNLNVKIELGRTRMLVEDVLRLGEGSVVELDKLAGDPVDVYVNERHVARGEVLVLNDNFCVRINEIVASLNDPASGR